MPKTMKLSSGSAPISSDASSEGREGPVTATPLLTAGDLAAQLAQSA